jgi:hypothetical protein
MTDGLRALLNARMAWTSAHLDSETSALINGQQSTDSYHFLHVSGRQIIVCSLLAVGRSLPSAEKNAVLPRLSKENF